MKLDERQLCFIALGVMGLIVGGSYAYVHLTDRPREVELPHVARPVQNRNDRALGGVWTMLDVDDVSKADRGARAALGAGKRVALLLQAQDPRFATRFAATIIGGSGQGGLQYAAQWSNAAPAGGPSMIDFGPEHIYEIL